MIQKLILIVFFIGSLNLFYAAKLSIEGVYQGKNVFIQNPTDASGFGYCISKIYVNGDLMPISLNSITPYSLGLATWYANTTPPSGSVSCFSCVPRPTP